MGHAAHFLRRLDRVSDAHVELALALYRDDELLRDVLSRASLPESAERVAISLADPVEGPFVVVTREGRFVTCLGEGMRANNLPIVTRERLDTASARVQRMRDELARIRALADSGADGQAALAFKRMQQQGPRFAREDAEILLRVQPLIERELYRRLCQIHGDIGKHAQIVATYRIDQPKRLSRAQKDHILALGDMAWAAANLIMMMGSPTMRRRFAKMEDAKPEDGNMAAALALLTAKLGTNMHVVRALWLLARSGKRALAQVKSMELRRVPLLRLYREMALAAIAAGSEKLRAEALKALSTGTPPEGNDHRSALERIAIGNAKLLELIVQDPAEFEEGYLEVSRAYAADPNRAEEPTEEQLRAVPDDVARIAWVTCSSSFHMIEELRNLQVLLYGLPMLVRLPAEQLFLPARWAQKHIPEPCVEHVLFWFRPYAEAYGLAPSRTAPRKASKVGRNDPCPCGSGLKHKRCCARGSGEPA